MSLPYFTRCLKEDRQRQPCWSSTGGLGLGRIGHFCMAWTERATSGPVKAAAPPGHRCEADGTASADIWRGCREPSAGAAATPAATAAALTGRSGTRRRTPAAPAAGASGRASAGRLTARLHAAAAAWDSRINFFVRGSESACWHKTYKNETTAAMALPKWDVWGISRGNIKGRHVTRRCRR